jgi:prolyl oligopeptidase
MRATPHLPLIAALLLPAACTKKAEPEATPPPVAAAQAPLQLGAPPATARRPVADTYHGVEVSEDYRWLEDGAAEEVKAWSAAQSAYARKLLDALPGRDAIQARVSAVMETDTESFSEVSRIEGGFLAMKRQPPKQQPFLVWLSGVDAPESARVVVDPNAMDARGTTHLDWYVPSPNGELVAVSVSKAGTESGDVHVYEVATGKEVFEVIPRVNGGTAGGALAWAPDGKGFYYTRYPRGEERPAEDRDFYQQLYFHTLGSPTESDRYELGKDLPRIAEIQLDMHEASGRMLVTVQKGDGGEFQLYLRHANGKYTQLADFPDQLLRASFGPKDDLYLLSRAGAPRGKVLHLPIAKLDPKAAKVIIPEGPDTIVEDFWGPPTVLAADTRLYVQYQLGGPSEVRAFTLDGQPAEGPKVPEVSAVSSVQPLGGDDLLFAHTSFLSPPAYYRYDAKAGTTTKTALAAPSPMETAGMKVVRELARSKDGTQVPVNIITSGQIPQDGKAACVVYGYGGYGVNMTPSFSPRNLLFVERGVVYALANIRGGGEFGEAWHRQGNLTHKQNVFDDFAAAVQHMVDAKYCAADRVGILGGSNGGLLMGATLVQHPSLAKVVVSFVGIYDMLRVELSANGAFNVTEFGTVKDKAQFEALFAYSPYHNVKDGVAYPPVLFITGENDPRVDPMQSRKMTARLQAASAPLQATLLRTSQDAGHGSGTGLKERVAQYVDMYAFFFHHLGVGR